MMKATQQDIGTLAQTGKPAVQGFTNFCFGVIDTIFHPSFDMAMTIFFRIEFWGIRGQVFLMNFRVLGQIRLDLVGAVCPRAVPDQNERSLNVSPDMFQPNQQFFRIDRTIKMAFVNLAADRQSDHRRRLPAVFRDPGELRGLAFGGPGEPDRLRIGQTKFIFKHDLGAEPPRFFLSGANPGPARRGSGLRHVRWRAQQVFAHSSPSDATSG